MTTTPNRKRRLNRPLRGGLIGAAALLLLWGLAESFTTCLIVAIVLVVAGCTRLIFWSRNPRS